MTRKDIYTWFIVLDIMTKLLEEINFTEDINLFWTLRDYLEIAEIESYMGYANYR